MAKRVFKASLSVDSIRQLQKDLTAYRDSLTYKCRLLVERLAEIGIDVAQSRVDESPLGKYVTIRTEITEEQAGCKAMLIAVGETKESEGYPPFNTLLAIEFGAGIHFNPIPNPNAGEFGLGVGTFPGQIHAFEDFWFYWDEDKQKWLPTHGVKATWPMYEASLEIQRNIVKVAKEVFSK